MTISLETYQKHGWQGLARRSLPGLPPEWQRATVHAVCDCLAQMQGCLALLGQPSLPAAGQQELTQRLEALTRRLNELVVSLNQAGSRMPAMLPLRPVLASLVAEYRRYHPAFRFGMRLPRPPHTTPEAAAWIQLVVALLLDNAVHCAALGTRIEVKAQNDPQGEWWILHIRSRGAVLPAECLGQLFEDPSQAGAGAVMGLAISFAQQIVDALGGRMWVESHAGQLTSFSFGLPRRIHLRRCDMPRVKVLIIDPDDAACSYLKSHYEEAGYEVQTVPDSRDGLELVQTFDPHLVVLAVSGGPAGGQAAFAQLRERTSVPVIIVSPLNDRQAAAEALWQGASDYLVKPYHVRELLARTRAILRRRLAAPRDAARTRLDNLVELGRPPKVDPLLQ